MFAIAYLIQEDKCIHSHPLDIFGDVHNKYIFLSYILRIMFIFSFLWFASVPTNN